MIKTSFLLVNMIILSALFIACNNEGNDIENDITPLTLDPYYVNVFTEGAATVKVSGGVSPYTVKEEDNTVAQATVSGNDIIVKGMRQGETTIKVTDNNGTNATFTVKVTRDFS